MVVAWFSGSVLVLINAVALRRVRLVLGWAGKPSRYVTSHEPPRSTQLSIPQSSTSLSGWVRQGAFICIGWHTIECALCNFLLANLLNSGSDFQRILYRFRDTHKARKYKIASFPTPHLFDAPAKGNPLEFLDETCKN